MSLSPIFRRFSRSLAVYRQRASEYQDHSTNATSLDGLWVPIDRESVQRFIRQDKALTTRFLRFLDRGFRGTFLIREDQWISYGWFTDVGEAVPHHLPKWLERMKGYWIFYCHTKEQFRGRGCFTALLHHFVENVSERNRHAMIYVDTDLDNIASRRAILSSGFSPCGIIRTYHLGLPRVLEGCVGGSWRYWEPHPALPIRRPLPSVPVDSDSSPKSMPLRSESQSADAGRQSA